MRVTRKLVHGVCVLLTSLLLISCATVKEPLPLEQHQANIPIERGDDPISRNAPVFIIEKFQMSYNRIGAPTARYDKKGKEEIRVDSDTPVMYYQRQEFETDTARYTNLIYRVHFEEVPFGSFPYHLTAGKNVGLLVVVTLNEQQEPVLLTTVNTCGCYLGFVPTSHLPDQALPEGWEKDERQKVFGEWLPGSVDYHAAPSLTLRPVILTKDETHRVKDLWLAGAGEVAGKYKVISTPLVPMEELDKLPINGETTSFFETEGRRKGYVKGSHKPLERLLMSWWAFDWRVGEDKRLGPDNKNCNRVFYTSLKFWARDDSNMWDFPRFLKYWGWRL